MAKKIKDTDYLTISARVRAMETGLLTRERMEQILEARSDEEAAKILQECGYPALDPKYPEEMDAALGPGAGGNSGRPGRRRAGCRVSGHFQTEI